MPKDSKPNIVLVVDNPVRDLPGLVLLAMELAKQGARAFLVPMKLQIPEIYLCSPDYVLLPYARVNNEALIEDLVSRGVKVGVLETEGGLFEENVNLTLLCAPNQTIRSSLSHIFMWGETGKNVALNHQLYQSEQILAIGSPRFDYYSLRFRAVAQQLYPEANAYQKPYVLFIGNQALANPRFQSSEYEQRSLTEAYRFPREVVQAIYQKDFLVLNELTGLANRLAKNFPEITFIYRPHPFEGEAIYYEKLHLNEHPNLYLIRRGSINGWIAQASLLIHRGSTTSFEAAMYGVPSLTPAWLPVYEITQLENISIQISSYDDMVQAIEDIIAKQWKSSFEYEQAKLSIVGEVYGNLDGYYYQRISTHILDVERNPTSTSEKLNEWFLPFNSARQRIRKRIIQTLDLPFNLTLKNLYSMYQPITWDSSEKRFTVDDVQKIIDAVTSHVEDFVNVRYRLQQGIFPQHRYLHGRTIVVETPD